MAFRITSEDILALLYRVKERTPHNGMPRLMIHDAVGSGIIPATALFWAIRTGMVMQQNTGFILTDKGDVVGSKSKLVQKHRLWESWLAKHTILPADHLHGSAHRVEHFIDEQLLNRVSKEADHPKVDPHGKPIGH
jgi:hypothetical protein